METLTTDLLTQLLHHCDLVGLAKLETACTFTRHAVKTARNLHTDFHGLRITTPFMRWFKRHVTLFDAITFKDYGPDAQLNAAHLGTALASASSLRVLSTSTSSQDASWTLPHFIQATCWDVDAMPPIETLMLGRGTLATPSFLAAFAPTLKTLDLFVDTEVHATTVLALDLPHLRHLSLTGYAGISVTPPRPMHLPHLHTLSLQCLHFTAPPLRLDVPLKMCTLICAFLDPFTTVAAWKVTEYLGLFWTAFPDSTCIDTSRLLKVGLMLGQDSNGLPRTVPSTARFPSLREIWTTDPRHDLTPSQIPFVSHTAHSITNLEFSTPKTR